MASDGHIMVCSHDPTARCQPKMTYSSLPTIHNHSYYPISAKVIIINPYWPQLKKTVECNKQPEIQHSSVAYKLPEFNSIQLCSSLTLMKETTKLWLMVVHSDQSWYFFAVSMGSLLSNIWGPWYWPPFQYFPTLVPCTNEHSFQPSIEREPQPWSQFHTRHVNSWSLVMIWLVIYVTMVGGKTMVCWETYPFGEQPTPPRAQGRYSLRRRSGYQAQALGGTVVE